MSFAWPIADLVSASTICRGCFRLFFAPITSRTRATGGVGLGLALAKRVMTAHGGSIQMTSELDVGTTVTFTLPCGGGVERARAVSGGAQHIS